MRQSTTVAPAHPDLLRGHVEYVPRIHLAEVIATSRVSQGLIRVTLGGSDMGDYPTTGVGDEFVRLFFPDTPEDKVRLPHVHGNGWKYEDGVTPSDMRSYTIRAHRRGSVDIDFVVHEGGVAAEWALRAKPGMQLGINPPAELYARPAEVRRQILIADEPALPAALRIIESTANAVATLAIIEVPGSEHRLEADGVHPADYTWICGTGNGRAPSALVTALKRAEISDDTYVWVATEAKTSRQLRAHLRKDLGMPGHMFKCLGYWVNDAKAWNSKHDAMGQEFHDRIEALYASDGDFEEIVDEVLNLYEEAGL